VSAAVRVLLDARKLGDGGIGIYIENLVDGLLELAREDIADISLCLLVSPTSQFGNEDKVGNEALARWANEVEFSTERSGKYSVGEYLTLARSQEEALARSDIFHSPHYTLPFQLEVPSVVTIHDAIHVTHSESFLKGGAGKRLIRSAMRRASALITVSNYSADVLKSISARHARNVCVIPNAVPLDAETTDDMAVPSFLASRFFASRGASSRYCLFLGSDRAHKGFDELLTAWTLLDEFACDLVLVGDRYSEASKARVRELGLQEKLHFVGAQSRRELWALIRNATALCVPSRVEGFGLPALEAMASGVSVVCSPAPALREVCGSTAWYAESFHPKSFADALSACLSAGREKIAREEQGVQRAAEFSRERHARATVEVYERVLKREILQASRAEPTGRGVTGQGVTGVL